MLPTILVSGATGKTGGALVRELLARDVPVRAIVRVRDARSDALQRLGAQVAVADIFDAEQIAHAMRGTQRAYFCAPIHPYAIQSAVAFAEAARETRLESIVQMSQWLSHRDHPAIMTRHTWLMDRLFADVPGVAHTILNPGLFADNFLRVVDFATLLGVFPYLSGDGKAAPVSNEDMARTAASVLLDPAPHAGKTYRPTGPQLLSGPEMGAIVGRVVGRRIRAVPLPLWLFRKVAKMQRIDPFQISMLRFYLEDMRRGSFAFAGGVTETVEALTGSPAESFETTARRYVAMPFARATPAKRARALANFLIAPLVPGYDLARLDRAWGFPLATHPTFSVDDERWRAEHAQLMAEQPKAAAATRFPARA